MVEIVLLCKIELKFEPSYLKLTQCKTTCNLYTSEFESPPGYSSQPHVQNTNSTIAKKKKKLLATIQPPFFRTYGSLKKVPNFF
jgi:hypothetical protein